MPAKTHGQRLDRLEQVVQILAEDQVSLQKLIGELATETRRGFDRVQVQFERVAEHMRETERRMRETDKQISETGKQMRETDKRFKHTDERVEKLVLAIGELIRTKNGHKR